jgi:hypothetical protein
MGRDFIGQLCWRWYYVPTSVMLVATDMAHLVVITVRNYLPLCILAAEIYSTTWASMILILLVLPTIRSLTVYLDYLNSDPGHTYNRDPDRSSAGDRFWQ